MNSGKSKLPFLILSLLIFFTSPWFEKISTSSFINALLVFLLALLLSTYVYFKNGKLLFVFIIIVFSLSFVNLFHEKKIQTFSSTTTEMDILNKRYDYYVQKFGKIYANRCTHFYHFKLEPKVNKYLSNLFQLIDPNYYFYASHPREMSVANEFEKFSYLLIPFFFVGICRITKKHKEVVALFLFSLIISSFYSINYDSGAILLVPFIVVFVAYGTNVCVEKLIV